MSILSDVRTKLAANYTNELAVVDAQPAMQEIWQQIQSLREEMNEAKKQAANKAAQPYIKVIESLELKYAMLLRLSS